MPHVHYSFCQTVMLVKGIMSNDLGLMQLHALAKAHQYSGYCSNKIIAATSISSFAGAEKTQVLP